MNIEQVVGGRGGILGDLPGNFQDGKPRGVRQGREGDRPNQQRRRRRRHWRVGRGRRVGVGAGQPHSGGAEEPAAEKEVQGMQYSVRHMAYGGGRNSVSFRKKTPLRMKKQYIL